MKKPIVILQPIAEMVNPHIWTDSRASLGIRFSLYEALVKQDAQGKYWPSLATSWRVSGDARTWVFEIRQGVRFHDGSPLTVEDVLATLVHASSSAIPGSYGTDALLYSYLGKAEFTQYSENAIQIITPEPMADLLDLLVNTVIVPARVITDTGVSDWVGSGPYKLALVQPHTVTMQRNEDYWGIKPSIETLIWKGEGNPQKRVEGFLKGEADFVTYLPHEFEDRINHSGVGTFINLQIFLCVILILNFKSNKIQDKRIRQALNYAVDVNALIEDVMGGRAARLNGPLSPLHSGCHPQIQPYPFNPDKARSLLAEAGYPDGIDLAFEVPTSSPNESLLLAEKLIAQYQKAGITLKPTIHQDRPAYAYMVKGKKFEDVCIFDSSPASSYRVLREKIHSGLAGPWWAGYSNLAVDQMMESAWCVVNDTQRNEIYQKICEMVKEDAPWVFLYNPTDGMAVRNGVQGWSVGMGGLLQFNG